MRVLAWVAFRAPTLGAVVTIWKAWFWAVTRTCRCCLLVIVVVSAVLHLAERGLHARLPRWRDRVATTPWGRCGRGRARRGRDGVDRCSGAGAEFIYFQF